MTCIYATNPSLFLHSTSAEDEQPRSPRRGFGSIITNRRVQAMVSVDDEWVGAGRRIRARCVLVYEVISCKRVLCFAMGQGVRG